MASRRTLSDISSTQREPKHHIHSGAMMLSPSRGYICSTSLSLIPSFSLLTSTVTSPRDVHTTSERVFL